MVLTLLPALVAAVAACWGEAAPPRAEAYADALRDVARWRTAERQRWERSPPAERAARAPGLDRALRDQVVTLSRAWLGTRWGLGLPQATLPGEGKINCGTFVGRMLRDAGFQVNVRHLQRQAASDIIRTLAEPRDIRWFRNASMDRFLADVRAMGPGLFIIGLDLHVGLLRSDGKEIRFLHASYETETVVDEPAGTASILVDSRLRVIGKLAGPRTHARWLSGQPIQVLGDE
jgi:hypothetical protein